MEAVQYYVVLDGLTYGPYTLTQIRTYGLLPDVQVLSTVTNQWVEAQSYPELVDSLSEYPIEPVPEVDIFSASYYIQLNDEMYGPLSISELAMLDITGDTLVSVGNTTDWQLANRIPNLMSTLIQLGLGSNTEIVRIVEPVPEPLATDELEAVIEDQEQEIMQLKNQLKQLEEQLMEDVPTVEVDAVNKDEKIPDDLVRKYQNYQEVMENMINKATITVGDTETAYRKVFASVNAEKAYYLKEYKSSINALIMLLETLSVKSREIVETYDDDMSLFDRINGQIHRNCSTQHKQEERQVIHTVTQQIQSLEHNRTVASDLTITSLKQYLTSQRERVALKYQHLKTEKLDELNAKKREVKVLYETLRNQVIAKINSDTHKIIEYYSAYFNNLYDTSRTTDAIWEKIGDKGMLPSASLLLGNKLHTYEIFDTTITILQNWFVEMLNNSHIVIRHNNQTKDIAVNIINTLVGKLLASTAPGRVQVTMVDTEEMDGTCDVFKYLNRDLFKILSRPDEIRKYLDEEERHISNIIQNVLLGSIKSIGEYNEKKENKEPYHVMILEDFPNGIYGESFSLLQKVLMNGVRTGVNAIIMINEDKINNSEDTVKIYNAFNNKHLDSYCTSIDLVHEFSNANLHFDTFTDASLRKIVQYVNEGVETREDEAVLFSDYMLPETEWWTRRSAKYIEVPFGVSENKAIQQLRITQESGQNSVVVIGIPGSGKSVFLHALICSAAINYSPDELNMYLIDFSGVEFNAYALNKLPHARVIAPEAEREFGLSILNELVEEGARRMALCRDNNVSNIVDLKAKNPSISVPRLLVIIDEFQKIFEIENDNISKEANAKIHIIIQEFRKFGINLVLATQKLPSSYILPKDLIANRVVFKSSPADFSTLITLQGNMKVPQLRTGECIYNSESGSPFDNHKTQGFLILKNDIDSFLNRMAAFAQTHPTNAHHDLMVFRGNDLPSFTNCRYNSAYGPQDIPTEVGIYFGESIAIDKYDVHTTLRKESGNNILIIGGETSVAQRIAYHAALSATKAHTVQSAYFFTFNFMRREDPLNDEVYTLFGEADSLPFDSSVVCKLEDVQNTLTALKEEVEKRRADEEMPQNHIYLTIYAFQLARMFDKGGRRGDDVSECGLLLDYVLKNGPAVGVFTILQCNNYESLLRMGNPLAAFTYRIALQMSENDSNKIISTSAANKLFVFNRPSSRFRAYYRDNNRNITNKFKPYK